MFLLYIGVALATIIAMEALSWLIHKYLLHGVLWFLHRSHHSPRHGLFEWNDLVSVSYSLPSFYLIYTGIQNYNYLLLSVGIGITIYGILYFFLHDIVIHRRVKIKYKFTNPYILRLIRAHKMHHKHQNKENGEAFGFIFAAPKYAPK